jgi:hypothetical protein
MDALPESSSAYEDLISRILAKYPDRLSRRKSGRIVSRRTTRPVSQAFADRMAKAGIKSGGQGSRPRPRKLITNAATLSPERLEQLGLGLQRPPRNLSCDPAVARAGYDFDAADAVVDLMRQGKVDNPDGRRYLYLDSRCGHAVRTLLLALPASEWIGMEADAEAVAWASQAIAGATFLAKPDKPPIDQPDASFDGVVALDLAKAGGIDGMRQWVADLWRLVKPGGFLITASHGFSALANLADEAEVAADDLDRACAALEAEGNYLLTPERELFSETWFTNNVLRNYWKVHTPVLGAGPDASDVYFAERRAMPLHLSSDDEQADDAIHPGDVAPATVSIAGTAGERRADRSNEPKHPQRFVVLAMQRTGSNMVVSTLNTHPSIYCHGELLRVSAPRSGAAGLRVLERVDPRYREDGYRHAHAEQFLEEVFGLDYEVDFAGFKLLLTQNPGALDALIDDRRYTKVLLCRDNVLARYSSNKLARAKRESSDAGAPSKVAFDEDEFRKFRNGHERAYGHTRNRLKATGQEYLEVTYLDACTPEGLRAIVQSLGADPTVDLGVKTPKRNSSDIVSRFTNPLEVDAFLRDHQLDQWRSEEPA